MINQTCFNGEASSRVQTVIFIAIVATREIVPQRWFRRRSASAAILFIFTGQWNIQIFRSSWSTIEEQSNTAGQDLWLHVPERSTGWWNSRFRSFRLSKIYKNTPNVSRHHIALLCSRSNETEDAAHISSIEIGLSFSVFWRQLSTLLWYLLSKSRVGCSSFEMKRSNAEDK